MDLYSIAIANEKKKGNINVPTDGHKKIRPILIWSAGICKLYASLLTHIGDWNTTCTVPKLVEGGACIFARARPISSLSGITNRRSKTNWPSPSRGSLLHSTRDGCPTIVLDWTVMLRAATLNINKKIKWRKLKPSHQLDLSSCLWLYSRQ
jgi:hypothetical protein